MMMLKKSALLAVAIGATVALAGCGEETASVAVNDQPVTKDAPEAKEVHSIAAAKNVKWPSVEVTDTDLMDSMPSRENIMVVLDMSGSMGSDDCAGQFGSKSRAAKTVLREWVADIDQETNLGLIMFDANGTTLRLPLGRDNRSEFIALTEAARPKGGTPLKTAVSMASQALEQQAALQQGYGRYKMMVITDGEHSGGENPNGPLNAIFRNPANPIEINTVGFCITDSALNQPGLTNYQSARNPDELRKGLDSVLAESMDFQPIEEFNDDA